MCRKCTISVFSYINRKKTCNKWCHAVLLVVLWYRFLCKCVAPWHGANPRTGSYTIKHRKELKVKKENITFTISWAICLVLFISKVFLPSLTNEYSVLPLQKLWGVERQRWIWRSWISLLRDVFDVEALTWWWWPDVVEPYKPPWRGPHSHAWSACSSSLPSWRASDDPGCSHQSPEVW